jgi:hypothetical protein
MAHQKKEKKLKLWRLPQNRKSYCKIPFGFMYIGEMGEEFGQNIWE